jgi:hypothetical protein
VEVLMRHAIVLLVGILSACDLLRPPTVVEPEEDLLQLHSVLWAGSDTVAVLVEEVGVEGGRVSARPVSGVRVRISGEGREVVLVEAPAGFPPCIGATRWPLQAVGSPPILGRGCYAGVLPGGVAAGGAYSLRAEIPGRGVASGATAVPLMPELLRPLDGTRLVASGSGWYSPVMLRWRTRPEARQVALAVRSRAVYVGGRPVPGVECWINVVQNQTSNSDGSLRSRADSALVSIAVYECRAPGALRTAPALRPDSVEAIVSVTAFDSAYTVYTEDLPGVLSGGRWGGIREGRASAGLTGAYGVFGSAAAARRRLMLVSSGR